MYTQQQVNKKNKNKNCVPDIVTDIFKTSNQIFVHKCIGILITPLPLFFLMGGGSIWMN